VITDISVREFEGEPAQWDEFVGSMPSARFSHQHAWMQLVKDVYGGEPHYLAAHSGAKLVGVLPVMLRKVIGEGRVLYATAFADEGGVCTQDPATEMALVAAALDLGHRLRASYLEVRQRAPLDGGFPCDDSRVTLDMPLPDDSETLWDSLSKNMRKKVRRARRDGLVGEEGGPEFLSTFYDIYAANMQELGSPMHSRSFFEALFSRFGDSMLSVVIRLPEANAIAGAAVAMSYNGVLTVLCAHSLSGYTGLFPSNLLYWHLFEAGIARGCRVADFGRSPRDTGIYGFKKSWHMEDHQLHYTKVPICAEPAMGDGRESSAYALFRKVWPKVPKSLARAIGPRLWARLPI